MKKLIFPVASDSCEIGAGSSRFQAKAEGGSMKKTTVGWSPPEQGTLKPQSGQYNIDKLAIAAAGSGLSTM